MPASQPIPASDGRMPPAALLDANVLFPTVLREILGDLAEAGLFTPIWSERILAEWVHSAQKLGADQAARAGAEAALLRLRFPLASLPVTDEAGLGVQLPDAGDLHVVAAALAGEARVIVTANLRDFPPRVLARLGLHAVHPDEFLTQFMDASPDAVIEAVDAALARAISAGGMLSRKDLLKRARLPRLSKAIERFGPMTEQKRKA